jgi:Cdc6-like AAA superfamily ATPase
VLSISFELATMQPLQINPFKPNAPISPGMFVGRIPELQKLESCLLQTKANGSMSFLITGERGIGKTSLLSYIKFVAKGDILIGQEKLNFLVIDVDIEKTTSSPGLIRKIESALKREVGREEKGRKFFADAWGFVKRIEAAGFKLNSEQSPDLLENLFDDFAYSLAETVVRITNPENPKNILDAHYDAVLILIDEADNASKELDLGSFIKLTLERLQKQGVENVLFGLAGLPQLKRVLYESHPSSLRVFEDVELGRLSTAEVRTVVRMCMTEADRLNKTSGYHFTGPAEELLIEFSEGYPHFIQQYGFCAFSKAVNTEITEDNVMEGAVGKRGALELIGDRYYRNDFYNKIQGENYRSVLRIMSDYLDQWVTKAQIKERFQGANTTLDNALHALRERNIILAKEGQKGTYRLQDRGFAHWIKLYTHSQEQDPDMDLPF